MKSIFATPESNQLNVLLPVVVGAAISLLPSLVVTNWQAAQQRRSQLIEHRINLIREASELVFTKGPSLDLRNFQITTELREALKHPESRPNNAGRLRPLFERSTQLLEEMNRLISEVDVEGASLSALFGGGNRSTTLASVPPGLTEELQHYVPPDLTGELQKKIERFKEPYYSPTPANVKAGKELGKLRHELIEAKAKMIVFENEAIEKDLKALEVTSLGVRTTLRWLHDRIRFSIEHLNS